jgi:predicted PurR-regulated permease PerM
MLSTLARESRKRSARRSDLRSSVQPQNQDLVPTWRGVSRLLFGLVLGVLSLFVFWGFRPAWPIVTLVLFAALIAFSWHLLPDYLQKLGNNEPVALLQGVSLWPTIAMRVLAIFISIYLILRTWRELRENWDVSETLKLDSKIQNKIQKDVEALPTKYGRKFWEWLKITFT